MTQFIYYFLKVLICSGIFYSFYFVFLRNRSFHQWNRFYLLFIVILSLCLPLIELNYTYTTGGSNTAIQILEAVQTTDQHLEELPVASTRTGTKEYLLIIPFFVISIFLFLSLLVSVYRILKWAAVHPKQKVDGISVINANIEGTPFSFFNIVFWNPEIDRNTGPGKQIFRHEVIHVKELHSLDKIFMELVTVLYWMNPFFWMIRSEIKNIHEFIADKKAVDGQGTAALAEMILQAVWPGRIPAITNQFFQTPIKRRIKMISKTQKPRFNYIAQMAAVAMIITTVLAFSMKPSKTVLIDKEITVVIDAGHGGSSGAISENIVEDDIVLALANRVKDLNTDPRIRIILTRPGKESQSLVNRVNIARDHKADLFISFHTGASQSADSTGIQIYVSGKNTINQNQSEILGSTLYKELHTVYNTSPRLKKGGPVYVLDKNVCPSVLIEFGYVTNQKDREFMLKEANQELLAEKVLAAIAGYAGSQK